MSDELPMKLAGEAAYVADAVPRPCLFGALLTVPAAHADVRIDLPLLRALDGVTAVLGPADAPATRYSANVHGGAADTRVFTGRSRFAGDVVGAVAATSRRALRAALDLAATTAVGYVERPAVLDLETAAAGQVLANDRYPGNRIGDTCAGLPDAEISRLLAAAPLRHRTRVDIAPAPHGFLEPVACGAQWQPDRVRVWSCSQGPQVVRDLLGSLLGQPAEVITPFVGGGFGGKEEFFLEPVAALLSRASGGRPVLVELDREQCSRRYRLRHGGVITVETGFTPGGTLLARRARIVLEAGPYDGHSASVAGNAAGALLRLYPALPTRVEAVTLATNRVPGGAFRAYGSELASMGMETHLDEVAAIAGCDPVDLRIMNCAGEPDTDPVDGGPLPRPRARACLETLREVAAGWEADQARAGGPELRDHRRFRRGRGVALMVGTAPAGTKAEPATSQVRADFDAAARTLTLLTGVPELGQGIIDLLTAVAVTATGLDPGRIEVRCTARLDGPADLGMFGNRGAPLTAAAAQAAISGLRRDIVAAHRPAGPSPEPPALLAGWRAIRRGSREYPLQPRTWSHTGAAATSDAAAGLAYGAALAEVEVDTATGLVTVLRVHSVHDVGKLLRPAGARGQVEGGLVQGIGIALSERAVFAADGTPDVRGFFSHLVPTMTVAPRIGVSWLEDPPGQAAPKGLGENTVAALPAAIANAVRAATGADVRAFPLSPPIVLDAIDAVRSASPARVRRAGHVPLPLNQLGLLMELTRRHLLRSSLYTAGGLAAASALAACGSGSGSSSSAKAAGSDLTAWTMQSSWINDTEFMGYFIAMDKGYYKAEGLDFTYVPGGPSVTVETTLIAGKSNIGLSEPDSTANAINQQGVDLVIVGAQFQKNPIGVVSLLKSGINSPHDLVGKRFAVPDGNRITVDAMFKANGIDPASVKIVPYAYDPTPLIKGNVDATLDFVYDVAFAVQQAGEEPASFLVYDHGLKLPNDVVVVTKDTLTKNRDQVTGWLRASRKGWDENFADPAKYPPLFAKTWFKGNGLTLANELYDNKAEKALMENPKGIFYFDDQQVDEWIAGLNAVGIKATPAMFDTSLIAEI